MNNLGCAKACELFPEWKACDTATGHTGYKAGDGVVSYCIDGQTMIGESVTADDNCDTPQAGSVKNPATWNVWTLESYIDKAAAEAVAAAGDDGVVTSGTISGDTLTLQRSVGGALVIPGLPEGQALTNCNGVLLAEGTSVATCDAIQATNTVVAGKQGQLQNCAGADHADGASVPSCAEMNTAIATAVAALPAIPEYTDCNGAVIAVDTPIVTCDNFGERFDDLLENSCLTLQDLGTTCGATSRVIAVECDGEPGKYKLGIISEASSEYGTGGFDNFDTTATPGALWPTDPDDVTSVMAFSAAENRLTAVNGVFADLAQADQDQLNDYRLFCANHNAACDEVIDFTIGATVNDTDENLTSSQFIYSINGVFNISAAGLQGFPSFNNKVSNFNSTLSIPVDMGANTICVYLVRPNTSRKLTQFSIRNSNGVQRPVWRVSKAGV